MREVPVKNYVLYTIVGIVSLLVVFYIAHLYNTNKEYRQNNSVLSLVVFEVKDNELESYLVENPNIVIYMASSKDMDVKPFEDKFNNYIKDQQISKEIVYLDTSKVSDKGFYKKTIKKFFDKDISISNLANKTSLLIVKDGRVVDYINKNSSNINIEQVEYVLKKYEVVR